MCILEVKYIQLFRLRAIERQQVSSRDNIAIDKNNYSLFRVFRSVQHFLFDLKTPTAAFLNTAGVYTITYSE